MGEGQGLYLHERYMTTWQGCIGACGAGGVWHGDGMHGHMMEGAWCMAHGARCMVHGTGCMVQGFRMSTQKVNIAGAPEGLVPFAPDLGLVVEEDGIAVCL